MTYDVCGDCEPKFEEKVFKSKSSKFNYVNLTNDSIKKQLGCFICTAKHYLACTKKMGEKTRKYFEDRELFDKEVFADTAPRKHAQAAAPEPRTAPRPSTVTVTCFECQGPVASRFQCKDVSCGEKYDASRDCEKQFFGEVSGKFPDKTFKFVKSTRNVFCALNRHVLARAQEPIFCGDLPAPLEPAQLAGATPEPCVPALPAVPQDANVESIRQSEVVQRRSSSPARFSIGGRSCSSSCTASDWSSEQSTPDASMEELSEDVHLPDAQTVKSASAAAEGPLLALSSWPSVDGKVILPFHSEDSVDADAAAPTLITQTLTVTVRVLSTTSSPVGHWFCLQQKGLEFKFSSSGFELQQLSVERQ